MCGAKLGVVTTPCKWTTRSFSNKKNVNKSFIDGSGDDSCKPIDLIQKHQFLVEMFFFLRKVHSDFVELDTAGKQIMYS